MALKKALAATNTVASTEPCSLYSLKGIWGGAAAAYLQIYDAKSLPANNSVPALSIAVAAASTFNIVFESPIKLAKGCVIGFSSTNATKTIVSGAGNTGNIFAVTDFAEPTALATESSDDDALEISNSEPVIILKVSATGDAVVDTYMQIHEKSNPQAGDKPLWAAFLPSSVAKEWTFGDGLVIPGGVVTIGISGAAGGTAEFAALDSETTTINATYRITGS